VVEECKTLEGHGDDILAMDAYTPRSLLATGDYEGRINVWNMNSGEKRMAMYHRSDRCVHRRKEENASDKN
jgi:WD40 repeat protein